MSRNTNTILWLSLFLLVSVVVILDYREEGIVSDWLFFVWLFNLNFLTYSIYNNGNLLPKLTKQKDISKLVNIHRAINYIKFVCMVSFIILAVTDTSIPYFNMIVYIALALDIVILLFLSKTKRI